MKLTANQRSQIVDRLVTNCACQVGKTKVPFYSEADRETLNGKSDEHLVTLDEVRKAITGNEMIAQLALAGFKHGESQFKFDPKAGKFIVNACGPAGDEEEEAAPEEDMEAEEEVEEEKPGDPRKKFGVENKAMSEQEWMRNAPPSIRRVLVNAQKAEQKQRNELISTITANAANAFSKDELAKMGTDMLQKLAKLGTASGRVTANLADDETDEDAEPLYFGQAPAMNVGGSEVATKQEDMLIPPTINWAENAAEMEKSNLHRPMSQNAR